MYIDEAYLQKAFGTDEVAALCPSADELSITIELAEAEVESALLMGGYSSAVPASVYASTAAVPKVVKLATYGAWLELAHLRRRKELPETAKRYTSKIGDIRTGALEIPGVPKNVSRAVGGVTATESSSDVSESDGSRPPVFDRETMEGY